MSKLPPEADRMIVLVLNETSPGMPTYERILLKKVDHWNPVIEQVAYTIWVPDEEREYTEKEIQAMREHCRKVGVRFQLHDSK